MKCLIPLILLCSTSFAQSHLSIGAGLSSNSVLSENHKGNAQLELNLSYQLNRFQFYFKANPIQYLASRSLFHQGEQQLQGILYSAGLAYVYLKRENFSSSISLGYGLTDSMHTFYNAERYTIAPLYFKARAIETSVHLNRKIAPKISIRTELGTSWFTAKSDFRPTIINWTNLKLGIGFIYELF